MLQAELTMIAFLVLVSGFVGLSVAESAESYEKDPKYWHRIVDQDLLDRLSPRQKGVAKNVILFLGDGMGISTVTASRILAGQMAGNNGEQYKLSFDKFPYMGLSKTYSVNYQTTDSAASATACLTGVKTNNGVLGLSAAASKGNCSSSKNAQVDSILRWSLNAGKSAGVVTTTRVTHASPAASYSHTPHRDWESESQSKECEDIALQLITRNYDINVIMGGGRTKFYPPGSDSTSNGTREDRRNLVQEWEQIMRKKNVSYSYVYNKASLDNVNLDKTDYLLGLFNQDHMNDEKSRDPTKEPSIVDMTEKAIKILQKNKKGFFLFVEGGKIDLGHHNSTAAVALHETVTFSKAVEISLQMTNASETLIVVTADHSNVMSMGGSAARNNPILGVSANAKHRPVIEAKDKLAYTTILYANGPGYRRPRQDVTKVDTSSATYVSQSAVPMAKETHGGEDVGIFATGPQSFLYTGVHEQNYIPMVMAYASCVGPYAEGKKPCAKYEQP
ncbi:alkaline phosphatase, tissue-nonspecific isozyme-like [Physella acuta]|uniref:alkaline phosphatase, tissue-nonspecific isozyme-like n=1 Tax=Physella acuta TaxID=109671 RepID=UPI0027DE7265|nr:alkaline phosphatase, tissue-nonspecific isozyme-like [Physella acuta]